MKRKNSILDVPTELRDAASSFKTDIGSKHWAKKVKVLSILERQEAKGKRTDLGLQDETHIGSPGKARQSAMIKIIPAPFVDRPLSERYVQERLIKTRGISKVKSIFWLCDFHRGKENDVTNLTILMFKTHDQKGSRVYALFHDRKGDDYSSYCCDGEVTLTYCFDLPHLVEHILSDKDMDAILHLNEGNLQGPE